MLHPIQRFFRQASRLLGCAILATAVAASPARAQLGGLVKKAKDAAVRKAGDDTGVNAQLEGEDVKYTDVILELTPERVDKVIAGMQASRAALAGRPALVDKRDAAATRLGDITERNSKALDAITQKRQEVESCRSDDFSQRKDAKQEGLGVRAMGDPAFLQKITDISTRMGEAQMKGDTAAIRKISAEMEQFTAPTAADSAAVDKACGAPVPPSATEKEIQSLQAQVAQLDGQIRSMEEDAAKKAAKACEMSANQCAMALERVEMWLTRLKGNQKQHGLSSNELKALNSKRAAIEKAM